MGSFILVMGSFWEGRLPCIHITHPTGAAWVGATVRPIHRSCVEQLLVSATAHPHYTPHGLHRAHLRAPPQHPAAQLSVCCGDCWRGRGRRGNAAVDTANLHHHCHHRHHPSIANEHARSERNQQSPSTFYFSHLHHNAHTYRHTWAPARAHTHTLTHMGTHTRALTARSPQGPSPHWSCWSRTQALPTCSTSTHTLAR